MTTQHTIEKLLIAYDIAPTHFADDIRGLDPGTVVGRECVNVILATMHLVNQLTDMNAASLIHVWAIANKQCVIFLRG